MGSFGGSCGREEDRSKEDIDDIGTGEHICVRWWNGKKVGKTQAERMIR